MECALWHLESGICLEPPQGTGRRRGCLLAPQLPIRVVPVQAGWQGAKTVSEKASERPHVAHDLRAHIRGRVLREIAWVVADPSLTADPVAGSSLGALALRIQHGGSEWLTQVRRDTRSAMRLARNLTVRVVVSTVLCRVWYRLLHM